MAAFLEVRTVSGNTFYFLQDAEDIKLMERWRVIDCGCKAYQHERAQRWPEIMEMRAKLTTASAPIPPNSTVYRVLA